MTLIDTLLNTWFDIEQGNHDCTVYVPKVDYSITWCDLTMELMSMSATPTDAQVSILDHDRGDIRSVEVTAIDDELISRLVVSRTVFTGDWRK